MSEDPGISYSLQAAYFVHLVDSFCHWADCSLQLLINNTGIYNTWRPVSLSNLQVTPNPLYCTIKHDNSCLHSQNIQRITMLLERRDLQPRKNQVNQFRHLFHWTYKFWNGYQYTRLPHKVFFLIRWIFTKSSKVLSKDHKPSVKFHNLPLV